MCTVYVQVHCLVQLKIIIPFLMFKNLKNICNYTFSCFPTFCIYYLFIASLQLFMLLSLKAHSLCQSNKINIQKLPGRSAITLITNKMLMLLNLIFEREMRFSPYLFMVIYGL